MFHNYAKLKCFLTLAELEPGYGMRASAIARRASVNLGSVYVLLPRWQRWKYVHRWLNNQDGKCRSVFYYSLTKRGRNWLKRAESWHPQFREAQAEVV